VVAIETISEVADRQPLRPPFTFLYGLTAGRHDAPDVCKTSTRSAATIRTTLEEPVISARPWQMIASPKTRKVRIESRAPA